MDRFWDKVDRTAGTEGCWPWLGARTGNYGSFYFRQRSQKAHRVAWILVNGEIPEGLLVCHKCDFGLCCNTERCHFVGTHLDNALDRNAKGRQFKALGDDNHARKISGFSVGVKNGRAKLDEGVVLEIRSLYAAGTIQTELAARFGVAQSLVSQIVRRVTWKHVL